MNLFGKKKKVNDPNSVILSLNDTLSFLDKREAHLEKNVHSLKDGAKIALKNKNKPKALYLLKKAKLDTKNLDSIYGHKLNIEMQIASLSQSIHTKEVFTSLKAGNSTLTDMIKTVNPDEVVELMDSIEEGITDLEEVSSLMAKPLGDVTDDDALLKELEELERENPVEEKVIQYPSVPNKVLENEVTDEEKELRELEAMMNS